MASKNLVSNLKVITSGNVPTTSQLANGQFAFGIVNGVARLFGNVGGTIYEFSLVRSVAGKTGAVTLTKGDVGLGNVDNVKQYSESNPPPYPVLSVNDQTGAVDLDAADVGAEPAFAKNTAFNKNFGSAADTVCEGDDVRLSNARTPTSHASSATIYGTASQSNYGHVKQSLPFYSVSPGAETVFNSDLGTSFKQVSRTIMHMGSVMNIAVDLNNYRNEGEFIFYKATGTLTNFPPQTDANTSNVSGHLIVYEMGYSDVTIAQLFMWRAAISAVAPHIWFRQSKGSSSAWTDWVDLTGTKTYIANLTASSWSGSTGNYTCLISATTHGCGKTPSVHTYVSNEETYDSPTIDTSGNITLHSNAKVAMRVVIKQ